jgi:hypothetical protein
VEDVARAEAQKRDFLPERPFHASPACGAASGRLYTRALSLSRLAYDLENLLSLTLAAAALVVLTYNALFAANALVFIVSALLVLSVRLPAPGPNERERGIWENLSFRVRAYLRTPRLRGLLALSLAAAGAGAMVIVNTVVYVRDRLGGTETDTALAFAAAGGGSMCVAPLLPRLLDRMPDRRVMLAGGLVLAAGLLLGLTSPSLIGLLPVWFVLGAGSSLIQIPDGTASQTIAARGRPARDLRRPVRAVARLLAGRLPARRIGRERVRPASHFHATCSGGAGGDHRRRGSVAERRHRRGGACARRARP